MGITNTAATAAADAASRIMAEFPEPPGLYLHVPFCSSICPFCPYNKVIYEESLATRYFRALKQELAAYGQHAGGPFTSLYIGGGTPTLCIEELQSLLSALPISGERAIEVLPGHATDANLGRLAEMGINYLSLGIQSFDQRMLDHLGRPNTPEENHRAIAAARARFDCVDVDLIFDVAFQDQDMFLTDLETCFRSEVEQVSTYPLMRFGYTPFGKARHLPRLEHEVLRRAEALADRYGYERRSVWTFNGRQTPSYTSITREFYLGCGAGSASYTGASFLVNHFGIASYVDSVSAGRLPIARSAIMSPIRAAAYYLFWQLYTGSVDVERFNRLFPRQRLIGAALRLLTNAGLLRRDGPHLALTPRGYDRYHDLERWVTYHFIEPLWADMMHEHEHLADVMPDLRRRDRGWLRVAGLAQT